ncbi:hypothetical protein HPB48_010198 [Haemaphysalis longicornis]|uniref:Uncharacterized protein n=1 Tax=Haemaphysalis longicornis TaxID=44386 RepID=A0A9J6GKA6_HAELO|nr:hypothetical protein HPB48_010198 [Haemaphysalis longicornis]
MGQTECRLWELCFGGETCANLLFLPFYFPCGRKRHKQRSGTPLFIVSLCCVPVLSELAKQQEVGTGYLRPVFSNVSFPPVLSFRWRYGRPQTRSRTFRYKACFRCVHFCADCANNDAKASYRRCWDCTVWNIECFGGLSYRFVELCRRETLPTPLFKKERENARSTCHFSNTVPAPPPHFWAAGEEISRDQVSRNASVPSPELRVSLSAGGDSNSSGAEAAERGVFRVATEAPFVRAPFGVPGARAAMAIYCPG